MYGPWVRVPAGSQSSDVSRGFFYARPRKQDHEVGNLKNWLRRKLAFESRQEFKLNERSECLIERMSMKKANAARSDALKSFELAQCGGEVGEVQRSRQSQIESLKMRIHSQCGGKSAQ